MLPGSADGSQTEGEFPGAPSSPPLQPPRLQTYFLLLWSWDWRALSEVEFVELTSGAAHPFSCFHPVWWKGPGILVAVWQIVVWWCLKFSARPEVPFLLLYVLCWLLGAVLAHFLWLLWWYKRSLSLLAPCLWFQPWVLCGWISAL